MDKSIYKQEINAVIKELENRRDNDKLIELWDTMAKVLWKNNFRLEHNYEYNKRINNIKKIKEKELLSFRKKMYKNDKTTLIVSGCTNTILKNKVLKLVQTFFDRKMLYKKVKLLPRLKKIPYKINLCKHKKKIYHVKTKSNTSKVFFTFRNVGKDTLAANVNLNCVMDYLFNTESGKLYTKFRSSNGLLYYIRGNIYLDDIDKLSEIIFNTDIDSTKISYVLEELLKELILIKKESISKKDLTIIQQNMINEFTRDSYDESPSRYVFDYANDILFHKNINNKDWYDYWNKKISVKTVKKYMNMVF